MTTNDSDNVGQAPPESLLEALPKSPGSRQKWSFQGPTTVLSEVHDAGCTCSYCRTFAANGRAGVELPENKGRNSWRIVWWRWKGSLHLVRWTLPKRPEGPWPSNGRGPWA